MKSQNVSYTRTKAKGGERERERESEREREREIFLKFNYQLFGQRKKDDATVQGRRAD